MTTSGNTNNDRELRKLANSLANLRKKRRGWTEKVEAGIVLRPSQKLTVEGLLKMIKEIRQKMLSMGANPDVPLPPAPPLPETPKSLKKKKRKVAPDPPNARRASGGVGVYGLGSQRKFWS